MIGAGYRYSRKSGGQDRAAILQYAFFFLKEDQKILQVHVTSGTHCA